MNAFPATHGVASGGIRTLEADAWRADVLEGVQSGMRAVTLFGRRQGGEAVITSVLQAADHSLHVSRCRVALEQGYPSITGEHPAFHCFERELHEQTGMRIVGHPWLKPIRFEGKRQSAMASYPFYRIEGKEVHEVAVGPIHAGIIEPGSFRFMCEGERIHHLEIQLGYQHRGVEERLLSGDPRRLAPLVETIAGDSGVAHAWAYSAAIESLAGCAPDPDSGTARAAALELERVAMHLAGLSGLSTDLGFLQGATTYGRLRTIVINSTLRLCGSRLGRGAIRPGGVGMRLPPDRLEEIRSNIVLLRKDLAIINDRFLSSQTVKRRLSGVGALSKSQAMQLGLVGMAARASGVALDARAYPGQGPYRDPALLPVVMAGGDCWSRARLRIEEMDASLAWLAAITDSHPVWKPQRKTIGPLQGGQFVVALVEGWRGEVIHCLETDESGRLAHYKVQDPSLRNWMGLAIAARGNEISDFPICNKSFDLSYCGNDL